MARRARVHSRDLQPLIAAPKGLFAAARVQRFDWPINIPVTYVDELGRKLHVGSTREIPEVTVTVEALESSHNAFAYLTGHTPGTFPVSGASITDLKNVDVIGQIRDASTLGVVNALYVRRGIVTGLDASFDVRNNSTVTYTVTSNQKKEFKQPVYYQSFTVTTTGLGQTLSQTPTYLTRTSGYIIDAFRTGTDGSNGFLDESLVAYQGDFNVTGSTIVFRGTNVQPNDTIWVTYCAPVTTKTFEALDNVAPAAIQGKYVPLTISVSDIPRVQSASIRASFQSESIVEMGGLGKPIGVELGIPEVTGDITVLKTDNELLSILEGTGTGSTGPVEQDVEYAKDTLPLKVTLKDPANPARAIMTYYVPAITINSEGDSSSVNASMEETLSWSSSTGELFIMSGAGVY
jgi:hypothetical protein